MIIERVSRMGFESIDDELEEYLSSAIEDAGPEGTSAILTRPWSDDLDELERVGMVEDVSKYYDMTASFNLTYDGIKYFSRKDKYEQERGKTGIPQKSAGIAGSFIGAAAREFLQ